MRKSTSQIIRTALAADETVRGDQIDAAMAILNERHAAEPENRPLALLITQAGAARLLCTSRWTIRHMVRDGQIQPVKIRGMLRYNRKDIEELAGERRR